MSAIHQLIAQQGGPDIVGSIGRAVQTAGALQQVQNMPAQMRMAELQTQQAQQGLDLGAKRLAAVDQEATAAKQQAGLKLAADAAMMIDQAADPAQKAAIYNRIRQQAASEGHDVSPWPEQYSDEIAPMLQFAKQRVYGGEIMKHGNAMEIEGVKANKPTEEMRTAQAMGFDLATPEGRGQYAQFKRSQSRAGEGDGAPSAVREFEYYQRLTPEQREEWDRNKRGDRVSAQTEKNIFGATDKAQAAEIQYTNYNELASQYESMAGKMSSGAAGSVSEWLKEQTGSQDAISLLRKDWAAVKASEVVKNLPPGAASDADVKMALAGFLPNNASPTAVASFLRGSAKLAKLDSAYQSFKADYLAQNKGPAGLNQAWKEYAKTSAPTGSTLSSGNQIEVGATTNIGGVEIKRVK